MSGPACTIFLRVLSFLFLCVFRETLSALPYLDAVIHEGLRLLPPAPSTIRETAADCVVPLSTPVLGRDGKLISEVHLKKGTTTFIREPFAVPCTTPT